MSSSQVYPSLSGTMDPESLCGDVTAGIVSTNWYAPGTYTYHDPYITPYPSSTVESQPWTQYARSSVPDIHLSGYGMHQQQPHQTPQQRQHHPVPHSTPQQHQSQQVPVDTKDSSRPRSSPSTFGITGETIPWSSSGLGIQYTTAAPGPTPATSTFPPNVFQNYPQMDDTFGTASPPEIRQPQPKRPYPTLAPNPMGAVKRLREDEEHAESSSSASGKKRKRTSSVASADLSEDDRFLVQLKEDENLPWKDIATRFQSDKGKSFQVAALQMRYKRLREKFRIWEDVDVQALKSAHEYWEKYKWEIISAKMLDYNVQERWPARHCARKWQEVEATIIPTTHMTTSGMTPASLSQFSSPVEGPVHFAFMPIQ